MRIRGYARSWALVGLLQITSAEHSCAPGTSSYVTEDCDRRWPRCRLSGLKRQLAAADRVRRAPPAVRALEQSGPPGSPPTLYQRGDAFADASPARGLAACDPHRLVRDGLIELVASCACGEKVEPRFPPAPVLAQSFQQSWTQRQIAIFAALARHHADDHALTVNVGDFETSQFAASHAGSERRRRGTAYPSACSADTTRP